VALRNSHGSPGFVRQRERLAETPVELDVRGGRRAKNELYERILARSNEHPDRVPFPVGRSR